MIEIDEILEKVGRREKLSQVEIVRLLETRQEDELGKLFHTARQLRFEHFNNKIFLYGFLYIGTYCRNNCTFCFYRAGNQASPRYRKSDAEIIEAARNLASSGVHLIDLTMGEDPEFFDQGFDRLVSLVEKIKKETALPIMVSPGVVPVEVLQALVQAGAQWYACYQETHNRELFAQLRPGQNYDLRLNCKRLAREQGLFIEEGVLAGVGETADDMARSIQVMEELQAQQVRAMNFVPQRGTPMEDQSLIDPLRELVYTAVLRMVFPHCMIPASLDVDGLAGLRQRLNAGANVVTSIVPPRRGLAGVAQSRLDIDEDRRTVAQVLPILEECGLKTASLNDMKNPVMQ